MELFIFIHMGGQQKDIVTKLLVDGSADFSSDLAKFDAGQAKCFLDRDRQKLWAVIEASFGTFEPFNRIVRGIFAEQLGQSTREPTGAIEWTRARLPSVSNPLQA